MAVEPLNPRTEGRNERARKPYDYKAYDYKIYEALMEYRKYQSAMVRKSNRDVLLTLPFLMAIPATMGVLLHLGWYLLFLLGIPVLLMQVAHCMRHSRAMLRIRVMDRILETMDAFRIMEIEREKKKEDASDSHRA